jgi:hypothetical protein
VSRPTVEQRAAEIARDLAAHRLEVVGDTPAVKVYRLAAPGTRMMSTQIAFTPEGIGIGGDFCPGGHGVWSAYGYGLNWFRGSLSGDYLASKFLTRGWVPEYAAASIREWADDADTERTAEQREGLRELAGQVDNDNMEPSEMRDRLRDLGEDCDDGIPGWAWDPRDHAALIAIQRRFADLWAAANPPAPVENVEVARA